MKKTSIILVLSMILNIFAGVNAFATVIDEKVTVNELTKGVTHTHVKKLTTEGWYNINYMKIDLNEPTLSLKVLGNKDTRIKSTVLNLAKGEENVIGAINADFFTSFSQSAAAEGMMIKDGEFITNPSNDPSYATFTYGEDKVSSIAYFTYKIKVISERTGDMNEALFYNKNADPMYLKIYDSNFGAKTPGSMDDGYEVVVEDGVVTKVLSNEAGIEIPKNGYVLHNSLRHSLFLMENFNVGDKVTLDISVSPDIENIKEAVGGGTVLLKNGEKAQFTLKDSLNPVTAVGIDKTGKIIYFFTVDGRSVKSRGMTFTETAEFLKKLGCYSAMSFDGGGSTAMAGKLPGEDLKHLNYQASYRPVINALSVVSQKLPLGKLSGIKISLSQNTAYKGIPVEVYINTAYDEYGNKYDLSKVTKKYHADKKGVFKDNVFYPQESGKVKITVEAGKVSESTELYVIDNAFTIEANKESFELESKKQSVSFTVRDMEGYGAYVPSEYFEFKFENADGKIEKDNLILTNIKDGSVTASFENASLTLPIGNFEVKKEIKDKFYKSANGDGYKFGVFSIYNYTETVFSLYVTGKRNIKANEMDMAAFKVIPEDVKVPAIRVSNYGREDTEHSLFIKLDNSKGGIVKTKGEQWDWLLNVFKKGVKQKNVFINMPLSIDEVTDKEELEILETKLKENLKDKNIFIITYGKNNSYKVVNGIRYIEIKNIPQFEPEKAFDIIENLKYGLFTIEGEDVSFEFKDIL